MKKLQVAAFGVCLLVALGGCGADTMQAQSEVQREQSEAAVQSGSASQAQTEEIADIIAGAASLAYRSNGEWMEAEMDSPEAKAFTKNLTALFPERFSEVASAYLPEEIVIRFALEERAQHNVNVNSTSSVVRTVTVSTVEFNANGVVFLLPQGTALGAVKGLEAILPTAAGADADSSEAAEAKTP